MSISAGEAALIRSALSFPHTLTRTPITAGAVDAWNDATATPGTPVSGLPCRYRAQETLRTDTGGRVTVDRPNMSLPYDSPLAVGDIVSAVTDKEGRVLLAGPLTVETVVPNSAFGPTLSLVAYFRGGTAR